MSIELDWESLTTGPDGARFEERLRAFLDDRFQQVALPRFVRSVRVEKFSFGTIPPELEIVDLCDPLDEFYEDDSEEDEDDDDDDDKNSNRSNGNGHANANEAAIANSTNIQHGNRNPAPRRAPPEYASPKHQPPFPTMVSQVHMPGANRQFGSLSGYATPFRATSAAAVAAGYPGFFFPVGREGSTSPGTAAGGTTTHGIGLAGGNTPEEQPSENEPADEGGGGRGGRGPSPEDFQVVCRVRYGGDLRVTISADLLLDFPLTGSVGIPVLLNVRGVSFDGLAVVARVRSGTRIHACFMPPPLDGEEHHPHQHQNHQHPSGSPRSPVWNGKAGAAAADPFRVPTVAAAMLPPSEIVLDMSIESEIGALASAGSEGRQALKNVSKVENFVLEQVRRVFERELVFPSFWTFLV